ncbi:MAG: STAS domain-containing protein [Magnetospirillum sp.]|nr:STAS domain-containing protein [Magnetospirillum sp.]
MQYEIKTGSDAIHLTISGRLTFAEAIHFPQVLSELAASPSKGPLEIHLSQMDFIDSTGMSLFVHIYDWTQSVGAKVTIHKASGPVYAALDRAAFNTLFEFK